MRCARLDFVQPGGIALCFLMLNAAAAQSAAGPQGPEEGPLRRQSWLVPFQDGNMSMRATLFRPAGPGPFPLVVINHGSVQNADQRTKYPSPVFLSASEFFVARGYAVLLPQRPGHGETGGPYLEANSPRGDCKNVDYRKAGLATADAIEAAITFMSRQSFVQRDGVIVVGQSAGGWGALGLASRNPRHVKAVVSFASGRGGRVHDRPNNNCAPEKLVEAAGAFGGTARIPVLAIYTENDSYFSPDLSKQIEAAYREAGGKMEYRLMPSFKNEGHALFADRDGRAIWGPIVDEFLKAVR